MSDRSIWPYLRNLSTVVGLVNAISAYVEKTVVGTTNPATILDNSDVRIRFWATAGLLFLSGVLTLGYLIQSTGDIAGDLGEGVVRQRVIALSFSAGQLLVAVGLATLLLLVGG